VSYGNATTWEEVLMRLKLKDFTPTHSITSDEHIERIKQKLAEAERLLKKE
jgi:hypothetical protein